MFGVLGFGLALGLGITTADLLAQESKNASLQILAPWNQ
jgi:hypothetical protein